MATDGVPISELGELASGEIADEDELIVLDRSDPTMATSGTTKRTTRAELLAALVATVDALTTRVTTLESGIAGKQDAADSLTRVAQITPTDFGFGFLTLVDQPTARAYIGAASPVRPVVDAGADQSLTVGTPVDLTGTLISATGTPSYVWSIESKPGGSSATMTNPTNLTTATFTPDVVGGYTIRLTVTDDVYEGTDDLIVTANAVAPRTALLADVASEGTIRTYRRRLASAPPTDGSWDDADIIIQSPFSYAAAQANKARNPAQYQIMYADWNSSRGYDSSSTPPGMVRYQDMQESWFMHFNGVSGPNGRGLWPYNQHWATNSADTDFQDAWLDAAMNLLALGFDGIYPDNAFLKWPYSITAAGVTGDDGVLGHAFTYANHPNYWPVGWRTQADVLARTVEFATRVYSTITGAGYAFLPNIGDRRLLVTSSPDYDPVRDDLGSLIDGMMDEYFAFISTATSPNNGIGTQLPTFGLEDITVQWNEADITNDAGQIFLACFETNDTTNTAKIKRAIAQYLLTNQGRSYFSFGDDNGVGPLASIYTGPLGDALENRVTVSQSGKVGCYRRRFQHGCVVYNTGRVNSVAAGTLTGDTFTTVALGGTYYLNGSPASSIPSVAPGDAHILYDS